MDWITWGQTATNRQPEFHVMALQIHLNAHDFIAAEKDLHALHSKVRDIELPDVDRLLLDISAKADAQAAAHATKPAAPAPTAP